jgi:hypothetical protein
MPTSIIKTPVRIMDFGSKILHTVKYQNDDSTGTIKGEENSPKASILPLTHRINYSICNFKNKVYIFGGINDKN